MCPIFILPCGGRSGSTWLARLLTSSKEILIWSETNLLIQRFDYINSVAYTYATDSGKNTDLHYFRKHGTDMWAAALRPFEEDFNKSWASMMNDLFLNSAIKEGYTNWGLKEVNWTTSDIYFIRKYWENYRIIFLVRSFLDCYRSSIGTGWLLGDSGRIGFIQEWLRMGSQISLNSHVQGKERIFKYDEIDIVGLGEWCGTTLKNSIPYVGSSAAVITKHDWEIISNFLGAINVVSNNLGYARIEDCLLPAERNVVF